MRNISDFLSAMPLFFRAQALLLLVLILPGVAQEQGYCKTFLAGDTATHFASAVFNNQPVTPAVDDGSEIAALSWTAVSLSVAGNTTRSLFYFNVSSIPADAEISSAKLYLFAKKDNTEGNLGNPKFGSRNGFLLQQVTGSWRSSGVNWDGQPAADGRMEKAVADDLNHWGNDTVDITEMVRSWVVKPAKNYGMLLRLKTEKVYNGAVLHPVAVPQSGAGSRATRPMIAMGVTKTGTRGGAGRTGEGTSAMQTGEALQGVSFRLHTASDFPAVPVLANSVIFYGKQAEAEVQPRLVVYYTLKPEMKVKLYPNPADVVLELDFVAPADGTALAEIQDISGHALCLRQVVASQGSNQLSFGLSGLSSGVYIMRLTLNGVITTKKFTIVH